ncbi:sterol desaturase family protein [Nostoc sp. 2RC]|uniref:sterol desaturase family protein n=1 Tax=Nostoc sp. 2RC TaxID=2485484 RepID=UPI0016266232|nr:sterol desaturase family protein [Nostoc sp. 2RC]MBC1241618.1 sterol desaturase family protein [Nostoc sp. 2RC]
MKTILLYWLMTFSSGVILWLWEKQDPLRLIKYKLQFLKEFKAALVAFCYMLINNYVTWLLITKILIFPIVMVESTGFLSLPLWVRFFTAFILKELFYYIIHRIQHANKYTWLTHKWHHSSESLWWLAAQRSSLTSEILYTFSVIWFPLLGIPLELMTIVSLHGAFQNNWIHLNVKSQPWMRILEWIYVTPRFHSLHHYDTRGRNFGDSTTIFDRLFGTYLNPDTYHLDENKSAGIDEPVTVKMIVGI